MKFSAILFTLAASLALKAEQKPEDSGSSGGISFSSAVDACNHCQGSFTMKETFTSEYSMLPPCVCMSTPGGDLGHQMYCSKSGSDTEMSWLRANEGCICRKSMPPLGEPGCVAPEPVEE